MSTPVPAAVSSSIGEARPIAGFHPNLWGHHFLKSSFDFQTIHITTQEQYDALKQEVSRMITSAADEISHKLHLIDAVQRLGVAYQFEKEIEDELQKAIVIIFIPFLFVFDFVGSKESRFHVMCLRSSKTMKVNSRHQ
ncbi:hypothetical protein AB3S75_019681 [Citrus x aurantiifolia]